MFGRFPLAVAGLLLAACQVPSAVAPSSSPAAFTAAEWNAACANHDDWDLPGPPFRIHGNTWYVGTCGISAVLVTGETGHILIDGGTEAGGRIVAANIARLGFDIADVDILLVSHEHYDHAGGLAYLQQASGGLMLAGEAAGPVLASGRAAADDPQAGVLEPFPKIEIGGGVDDGDTVNLGFLEVTAIATPGHTAGAMSWTWRACDGEDCRQVVYLDSLSAVSADGYRFSEHPGLVARFRASLDRIAALPCDIVLTPHPSASRMPDRIARPEGLTDPTGCASYAATMRERLDRRLASEAAGG